MTNYIIVGQGIAGSSLALRLIERGCNIKVYDTPEEGQASRVASGLWNPIVLKRMKKVWMADEFLSELIPFYKKNEQNLGISIIDDCRVLRLFHSAEEANDWLTLCDSPSLEYILDNETTYLNQQKVNNPFGVGIVARAGRINTKIWLDAQRNWLKNSGLLAEEAFDYSLLTHLPNGVDYQGVFAKGIIFCEGMHTAISNPFFKHLPFALTKGETIDVHAPGLKLKDAIHASVFILPLGDEIYKVGATYAWNTTDKTPTAEGRNELESQLKKFLITPYEVVGHSAGIRPTIKDRRPLLGTHEHFRAMHIFNGLGSRGVLMAPYLSARFTDYLLNDKALPKEVDITRFNIL